MLKRKACRNHKAEEILKIFFHYRLRNLTTKKPQIGINTKRKKKPQKNKRHLKKKVKIRRHKTSVSAQDYALTLKNNIQTKMVQMGGRSTEKKLLHGLFLFYIAPWSSDLGSGTQLKGNNSCAQAFFQGSWGGKEHIITLKLDENRHMTSQTTNVCFLIRLC